MSRINPQLLEKLQDKLGLSRSGVYQRINAKANELFVPRPQAAIALAADHGIGISRFATVEDLQVIRQASGSSSGPAPVTTLPGAPKAAQARGGRWKKKKAGTRPTSARRGNSVFVVHGRNEPLRRSLFAFLRSIGLKPIEWRKAIQLTGKPSPFVAEILDAAFREAVAIVVLLTPDDEAKLKDDFLKRNDPPYERQLTGQARPNVLFEAGMAFGRNPDATVLVQVGDVRPFSDVAGRHLLRLSNSTESRQEFVTKLANAGCNVDGAGTDWHTEGDFEV